MLGESQFVIHRSLEVNFVITTFN